MKRLGTLLVLASVALAISCGGGSSSPTKTQSPPPTTARLIVSPATATVPLSGTKNFTAKAPSGTTPALAWSVNGVAGGNATVGTITSTGHYTAPDNFPSDNTITVTAAAASNPSQKGSAAGTIVFPNHNGDAQSAPVKMGT